MATPGSSDVARSYPIRAMPVRRTPSKLYRQTIQAEVALPTESFAELGLASPVRLLSLRSLDFTGRSSPSDCPPGRGFHNSSLGFHKSRMENGGVTMENSADDGGEMQAAVQQEAAPAQMELPGKLVEEGDTSQEVVSESQELASNMDGNAPAEDMAEPSAGQQTQEVELPVQVLASDSPEEVESQEQVPEEPDPSPTQTSSQTFVEVTKNVDPDDFTPVTSTKIVERKQIVSGTGDPALFDDVELETVRTVESDVVEHKVSHTTTLIEKTEESEKTVFESVQSEKEVTSVTRTTEEDGKTVEVTTTETETDFKTTEPVDEGKPEGELEASEPTVEVADKAITGETEEAAPPVDVPVKVETVERRSRSHSSSSSSSSSSKSTKEGSQGPSETDSIGVEEDTIVATERTKPEIDLGELEKIEKPEGDDKADELDQEKRKSKSKGFFSFFTRKSHHKDKETDTPEKKKKKKDKKAKKDKASKTKDGEEAEEAEKSTSEASTPEKTKKEIELVSAAPEQQPATVKEQASQEVEFEEEPATPEKYTAEEDATVEQAPIAAPEQSTLIESNPKTGVDVFVTSTPEPAQDASDMSVQTAERTEVFLTENQPKRFILPTETLTRQESSSPTQASPQPSTSQLVAPLHSPNDSFDSAIAGSSRSSVDMGKAFEGARPPGYVVVAIDFGTTFSGYAFSFVREPDSIHMMRRWEGGDPGVINQKTPTTLLLTPDCKFHSFGFTARDFFHDLDPQEAKKWLYFEKFKMALHYNSDLNKETMLKASNGKLVAAITIFSHALRFFKEHALQELSDQSSTKILNEDVRWVITVPAIWKSPAKQFMRQASYAAGIASSEYPDQLLIALEPEAASIYIRKLRMYQLVPEHPVRRPLSPRRSATPEPMNMDFVTDDIIDDSIVSSELSTRHDSSVYPIPTVDTVGSEVEFPGTRYMVVDCGGGTVDITVHEMEAKHGNLLELYKATGGPYGSVGVDIEFEKLLVAIFGADFIEAFKYKRPAGWVDLMIAFESRKRASTPYKTNPLNVSLPFSFIDYHKKYRGCQVESAIRKYGDREVRWSSQGMLRLTTEAMRRLFMPTIERIKQTIGDVLNNPAVKDIKYLFLVGGFAESQVLQCEIRKEFGHLVKILIPQDVGLTILKGAVCFGLNPTVVNVRKSRMTYGVGVLNRFVHGKHPNDKLVKKDNVEWCTDVFDRFVLIDQSVALGDSVLRSYTPAKPGQKSSVINIYSAEKNDVTYITDSGVKKCGALCLDLSEVQYKQNLPKRREIQTRMIFGDTEIKVSALDVSTGKCVKAAIDFLNK